VVAAAVARVPIAMARTPADEPAPIDIPAQRRAAEQLQHH
jgi:hypothetical protein